MNLKGNWCYSLKKKKINNLCDCNYNVTRFKEVVVVEKEKEDGKGDGDESHGRHRDSHRHDPTPHPSHFLSPVSTAPISALTAPLVSLPSLPLPSSFHPIPLPPSSIAPLPTPPPTAHRHLPHHPTAADYSDLPALSASSSFTHPSLRVASSAYSPIATS